MFNRLINQLRKLTGQHALYNSIFKSVLLYKLECWQIVETDFHKIEEFYNGCLRSICRIFWPRTISNLELHAITNSELIQTTIKARLRWLGQILRMSHNRISRVALKWILKRKRLRQWVSHGVRRK